MNFIIKQTLICLFFFGLGIQFLTAQNVGIGTQSPQEQLHVSGKLQVDSLAGQGNRPVMTDQNGVLFAGAGFAKCLIRLDSINELDTVIPDDSTLVQVLGYYAPNDGGGGLFFWDAGSTLTEDLGTIFESPINPNGRWRRHWNGQASVKWFGAKGDGTTEDTQPIQQAVNTLLDSGGGTLWFPKAVYLVSSIDISHGLHLSGYGAVLKKVPNAGKWPRIFTTQNNQHLGPEDSAPLVIEGFEFDGNRLNQGPYTSYQLEQQHMIFLMANSADKGRLKVTVQDCYFHDGVADAISVYKNVDATVKNCKAINVFRGGVTITGGNTRVQVSNLVAGGDVHPTGIDLEVDGAAYNGSYQIEVEMNNIWLEGDFDVGLKPGSTFLGNNIYCNNAPFSLYCYKAKAMISNSYFVSNESAPNRIYHPENVTFSNCTFKVKNSSDPTPPDFNLTGVYVIMSTNSTSGQNQAIKFSDCRFELEDTVTTTGNSYAIAASANLIESNNTFIIDDCHIGSGFTHGIYIRQGGILRVNNTYINADQAMYLGSSTNNNTYNLHAHLNNVSYGPDVSNLFHLISQPNNIISHQNMILDASQNVFSNSYSMPWNRYQGRRTIMGDTPPVNVPGLTGDIYRLKIPASGSTYEWICTASSPTSATWVAYTDL